MPNANFSFSESLKTVQTQKTLWAVIVATMNAKLVFQSDFSSLNRLTWISTCYNQRNSYNQAISWHLDAFIGKSFRLLLDNNQ